MHSLLKNIFGFVRREAVLSIALLCALLSMLAVPPDAAYAGYIDLRVLCLLFCLMAVVLKYLSVLVDLVFKRQKYRIADIDKISSK